MDISVQRLSRGPQKIWRVVEKNPQQREEASQLNSNDININNSLGTLFWRVGLTPIFLH